MLRFDVANDRSALFEYIRFLPRPLRTAATSDADRYLAHQPKKLGRSHSTTPGGLADGHAAVIGRRR